MINDPKNISPIYEKDLGIEDTTGSPILLKVWRLDIDARRNNINIEFELCYLSPKGVILKALNSSYSRFNREDVLYSVGEIIIAEVRDDKGQVVTPAVIATGTEIKIPANMKYDLLKASNIGKMIIGMIKLDVDSITSIATIDKDLAQY